MADTWDRVVDVLVAGTGAAGLTAAIAAADAGRSTLLLESTSRWGGTTNYSGGGLWMPTNPLMASLGIPDSVDDALAYMDACIGDAGPASSPERRRAFVETVPEVFRFLEGLGVRWASAKDYPDYYPDLPGGRTGRALEVEPFDVRPLGDWFGRSRSGEMGLPPVPLKTDDVWLLTRAWSTADGLARGAQFVGRTIGGFARGKRLYGMGAGLVSNLMSIVRGQGTEVILDAPLTELVVEDGAVVGVVSRRSDGFSARIGVRDGVVLAAGGFAHRTEWREQYHGISGYSSAPAGDRGTAIEAAAAVGAQLALMDDAWWGASVPAPDGGLPMFVVGERSFPFSIIVDSQGHRYVNESASYIDVGHAMLERNQTVPAIPSWLVMDARHRHRYLSSFAMQGTKKLRAAGILRSAETIGQLASVLGMDPAVLGATVDRFNGFARQGVDDDFGRGRTAYDNYYGDPRVKPNPNLGPLEKGPFTAVQLVPGDLGTKGGVLTDADGRALDDAGQPIPGLYAAGNASASVMGHTYPGPGSTIGPAVVFGYRAARHAARRTVLEAAR